MKMKMKMSRLMVDWPMTKCKQKTRYIIFLILDQIEGNGQELWMTRPFIAGVAGLLDSVAKAIMKELHEDEAGMLIHVKWVFIKIPLLLH